MNLSRRSFMGGAFAAGILTGCRSAVVRVPAGSSEPNAPKLRLGVMSDIHVYHGGDGTDNLESALLWFREQDVDGVVCSGDLAHLGDIRELRDVGKIWDKVFPKGRGRDGRRVEPLFIYGNHDFWFRGNRGVGAAPIDHAAAWKEVFHEDYAPIWKKTVKGYTFIGAHWDQDDSLGKGNRAVAITPRGLKAFMEKEGPGLPKDRPFFYIQHPHPKDTCFTGASWTDEGTSTAILSAYPNAVALTGHSHYSLTDERSVWQGAFTSIENGSMRYTSIPTYDTPDGFENAGGGESGAKMMNELMTCNVAHGMLMDVYDDHLHIQRRDFFYDRPLGDDWIVPLPARADGPLNYADRAKASEPPEFPEGTEVSMIRFVKGKNRKGEQRRALAVTFPCCPIVSGCRAFGYEVRVIGPNGELARKNVVDLVFNQPKVRAIRDWVSFMTDAEDWPVGAEVHVEIRPYNCWHRFGKKLVSAKATMKP